jgi:hypothetical protein
MQIPRIAKVVVMVILIAPTEAKGKNDRLLSTRQPTTSIGFY